MNRHVFFIGFLFSSITLYSQGIVQGKVEDARTLLPVPFATIQIIGTSIGTTADSLGNFQLETEMARFELKFSAVGYSAKQVRELYVSGKKPLYLEVLLESRTSELEEVKIVSSSPNLSGAISSLKSITMEEVMRFPATFFDPARLVMTFPGVAPINDQANGMSIRGNHPNALQWRLEGVEIVNPNHLANAGTFSDQPAINAGGTNMLSAQLLGNMNFLTGAFPAEYGNSGGGVMDMRLRAGSKDRTHFTLQAGLIGLDLSAEGPLFRNSKSSYLINYRYSFTGLLAAGGITFGGESIVFQDLAMHFNFPLKNGGNLNFFSMGGLNSNEFSFEDEEGLGPQETKDLFGINYYGRMGLAGSSFRVPVGERSSLKLVGVYSGAFNSREQFLSSLPSQLDSSAYNQERFSLAVLFNSSISTKLALKSGVYSNRIGVLNANSAIPNLFLNLQEWYTSLQPFISISSPIGKSITGNLGLHSLVVPGTATLEPRASLAWKVSSKNSLNMAYGRHSQDLRPIFPNADLPLLSNHFVLNFTRIPKANREIKAELFLQKGRSPLLFSSPNLHFLNANSVDAQPLGSLNRLEAPTFRNYGIELGYQRFLEKGLFLVGNTTLFRSLYENRESKEFLEGRYSANYIVNFTLGKEWSKKANRTIGFNGRIVAMGGLRDFPILETDSRNAGTTVFDYAAGLTDRYPVFFRPDLRIYLRKVKKNSMRMWSLDLQNIVGRQNLAFRYFDLVQNTVVDKNQLGLIPMLNYRVEW